MEQEPEPPKMKSNRKSSFLNKSNQVNIGEGGTWQRPKYDETESSQNININEKLYSLMQSYIPSDKETIQETVVKHVEYTLARTRFDIKPLHAYQGVAHSVRDRLMESFNDSHRSFSAVNSKRVYYMSLEFLIGRCLQNSLININLEDKYKEAMMECGFALETLYDQQVDPALGNGGLGRLAACFLDSLATLNYPAWGYGIRYDYGIFRQIIKNGYQIEAPDYWLTMGNPWQIERIDVQYKVKFYGNTRRIMRNGREVVVWQNCQAVVARAYDTPIPGYATFNTLALRLWRSLPTNEFDFNSFNVGDYFQAVAGRQKAEYITSVLYPNDSTEQGRELRLKQEYLLCSASIQDIVRRHKQHSKMNGKEFNWSDFPKQAAIQLNDTHPTLAIIELLRIMIDQEDIKTDVAWEIIYGSFAYTNHTVLPEALEKWDVDVLHKLLPRHLELIYMVNTVWLQKVSKKFPGNGDKMRQLSIVEQSYPKKIRMAHICIVGSHAVNGVAQIHSEIIKSTLFKNFHQFFPNKFQNKTNGVTPRRWILLCNPLLSDLLTDKIGTDEWVLHMDQLKSLESLAVDENFQNKWRAIKRHNKKLMADWVKKTCHIDIDVDSMFDVQVKRIHEYKRQFMNILYVIHRYLSIKAMDPADRKHVQSRTIMFGGKAAPAYVNAKRIIKLINEVGNVVNNDPLTKNLLKVIFLPNYNVSNAQIIIPASELSQHISTAGTEASGTSNMKFAMNGCLIVGTMDGANVQISEEVGPENIFIFGARIQEVQQLKQKMRNSSPDKYIPADLKKVFAAITQGRFGSKDVLSELVNTVSYNNDFYLLCNDFTSYVQIQEEIDKVYKNKQDWTKRSILNTLRSGKFSSDRTIHQYAKEIWNVSPLAIKKDMTSLRKLVKSNIEEDHDVINKQTMDSLNPPQ